MRYLVYNIRWGLVLVIVAVMTVAFLAGCKDQTDARDRENKAQGTNYESLQNKQPANSMDYSPTREGLNKWMETWEEPGKVAYVYLTAANGQKTGYYVFEGLPVSYCASLTPPENLRDVPHDGDSVPDFQVQAPSMDGVYYSGSGCSQFFGFDAVSGSYIEFSAGGSQNFFVTEQPLPDQRVEPLGFATIEEVEKQQAQD